MRIAFILATALCVAAPCFWTAAAACGDKFVIVGRSARFDRVYAALYPATILVYTRPSARSGAILDSKFQAILTRAGHAVEAVNDETLLAVALKTRRFDFVLADVNDVAAIQVWTEQALSRPTVVPVLYKPTKAELEFTETRSRAHLIASDRPARYLSIIDAEMQARVKSRSGRKQP